MTREERIRIAVFIDFDNVEIGLKNTLNLSFDAGLVLDALKERGEVVAKLAYGDWQRSGGYSRMLTQHAIRMVQRNPTPGGDKNGADINLALDALEMAFTHTHINTFVIVGGDSDFISLVEKLKQYDKQIFIVGGRQFTSQILQRNCHEFIAYENLTGGGAPASAAGRGRQPGRGVRTDRAPIEQAVPLVSRALKVLSEREGPPQLGLLKTTLLQLDSTFSERTYGAGSFRDFAEKLQKAGLLTLFQGRGGWMVGPANGAAAADTMTSSQNPDEDQPAEPPAHVPATTQGRPTAVVGTPADGVRELARTLGSMQIRRWPLYLRNVKQLLRQAQPAFDERAYGFTSLVDLLRAAHKEGALRVERDRQGVIRVFQGTAPPALHSHTPAPVVVNERPDAPDADVAITPADLGVPLPALDTTADEAPQAAEEEAPATASGRHRRRRVTGTRRPSRKKAVV
ncbi:MAG: NYN domain-containing protein [Acidobacteriota bacterium]